MTTLSQYQTQRATAGTTYATAVSSLLTALIDLAALDATVGNAKALAEGAPFPVPTFGQQARDYWQDLPRILSHDQYCVVAPQRIGDAVQAAANTYIAALA